MLDYVRMTSQSFTVFICSSLLFCQCPKLFSLHWTNNGRVVYSKWNELNENEFYPVIPIIGNNIHQNIEKCWEKRTENDTSMAAISNENFLVRLIFPLHSFDKQSHVHFIRRLLGKSNPLWMVNQCCIDKSKIKFNEFLNECFNAHNTETFVVIKY